jgi:hypothetical protein
MQWPANSSVSIADSGTYTGFATRAPSNYVEIGGWKHRLKDRVDYSSRDLDDRNYQLIVGRRTSAIDEKLMMERTEPLMAARMTNSSSM